MRILHLLSYHLYTGPAEPVLRLARAQMEAGHQVELACDSLRPGDMEERARGFSVPLQRRLALSVKSGPIMLLRDVLELRRLWREGVFDVLHAHLSHDHALALLARPRRSRSVLVRTLHTEGALRPGRRWMLARTDGLITICRAHRRKILDLDLAGEDACIAVEGAVDTGRFFPDAADDGLRRELGISPDVSLAGMVARMKAGRGHRELILAWSNLLAVMPRAVLLVVGRGELESELRQLTVGLGLERNVLFTGYRTDLPRVYRGLDLKIMLAPGRDGTCRAVLEAMACGTPVLAARRGALADIVEEGRSGFFANSLEPEALASTIEVALQNRARLREMGRWAAAQAGERFSIERQRLAVHQLYQHLLSGRRRAC